MLHHLKKATNNVTVRTFGIFPPAEWSWEKKSVCHFGLDWLMEKHQLNCQSCDEKCCRQCPRGVNWIRNVELKNVNTEKEKISLNERTQSLVKTQFCWKVIPSNLTVPRCSSEPESPRYYQARVNTKAVYNTREAIVENWHFLITVSAFAAAVRVMGLWYDGQKARKTRRRFSDQTRLC